MSPELDHVEPRNREPARTSFPVMRCAGEIAAILGLWVGLGCAPRTSPATPEQVSHERRSTPSPAAAQDVAPAPARAASHPAPPPIEGYTVEVADVLAQKSVWYRLGPTRIAVPRRGEVRLTPDGQPHGLADLAPFPDPRRQMVIDDRERPRVAVDDHGVRLLLHVERSDARPVVIARAPLRSAPDASIPDPPVRGYVALQPGAWVDIATQTPEAIEVRYRDGDLEFTGWISPVALGTTCTPQHDERDDDKVVWIARRSTDLSRTPGGKRLTRIEKDAAVVELRAGSERGSVLVEYEPGCVNDYAFVGFVPRRDLFQPNYGMGHGCGEGGGHPVPVVWGDAESSPRVQVEAGRFLLDADTPVIVGCVLHTTELADLGDDRLAVPTIWGPIPVRLAPEGFGRACGTGR